MNHVFFGIIWVLAQILRLLYRIEVKGLENLPRNGVLLCPNHASDLDPVLIGICLPINYRLHFMAKEELFPYVAAHGTLPRKTFSMGEAKSKRYYLEARVIR